MATKPQLPHCNTDFDYSVEGPRVLFAEGGRLVKLKFARSPSAEWNAELFGSRGGVRGKCKGFSFGSRRRMLDRLNSVSVAASLPYFVTATLPDEVFDDNVSTLAETAKVWLDAWVKRLRRVEPGACGFWRIELQSRKSGQYEGKLFPHFHLLVWGLPDRVAREEHLRWDKLTGGCELVPEVREAFVHCKDNQLSWDFVRAYGTAPVREGWKRKVTSTGQGETLVFAGSNKQVNRVLGVYDRVLMADAQPDNAQAVQRAREMSFQDWASLAWYHVVDSHNVDHLSAGLRVERVRTWGGVMSYCAKYMAKADCGFLSGVSFGRSWGVFNKKGVPWAKMIELELDSDVGVRLRRVARHFLERRCGRKVRAPYGLTVYCNVESFKRLWAPRPPPDPF